jgi:hypothetical protein
LLFKLVTELLRWNSRFEQDECQVFWWGRRIVAGYGKIMKDLRDGKNRKGEYQNILVKRDPNSAYFGICTFFVLDEVAFAA